MRELRRNTRVKNAVARANPHAAEHGAIFAHCYIHVSQIQSFLNVRYGGIGERIRCFNGHQAAPRRRARHFLKRPRDALAAMKQSVDGEIPHKTVHAVFKLIRCGILHE